MALTLLAHGSPDGRHSRDVSGLAERLSAARVATQVAYLDHDTPTPAAAARALVRDGHRSTTVVPLLVSPAYHARVDVPAAVEAMRRAEPELSVVATDPIGLHPQLLDAAAELVRTSGRKLGPRTGVILAAAGSRDPRAVAGVDALVRARGSSIARALGVGAVRGAYLDGGRPLGRIRTLMRCVDLCTSFVVVPLVIADGVIRDRIVRAAALADLPVVEGSLADTGVLMDVVLLQAASAQRLDLSLVGAGR